MQPFVGYLSGMDVRRVVAENIQTLLDYARDHQKPYADAKALAVRAGLSPSTVGHILKCEGAAKIDTLEAIAQVYKLSAWSLLIPNLDPSNPPVVPYTDTERALYWRIKSVAKDFVLSGGLDEEEEPLPSPTDADPARPLQAATSKARSGKT